MDKLNVKLALYQLNKNISLNSEDNICIYSKRYQNHIIHLDND